MKYCKQLYIFVFSVIVAPMSLAGVAEIGEALSKTLPTIEITKIEQSEIEGLYRVKASNGPTLFTNEDASFFLTGDMYTTLGGQISNLTEARREKDRAAKVFSIKDDQKIVFPAKGEAKARIAVFTDIDCGYCRKLHREVPKLNELGIEVSYLAFPRGGANSPAYTKAVSAWCSKDQLKAMTDAKSGKSIPTVSCKNPVAEQYELGQQLGVNGTPAIVLENGTLVPGYMSAEQLASGLGLL